MAKKTQDTTARIDISAPKLVTAKFRVIGSAPYVQNKFSAKAMEIMRATQEAGSTAKKGSKKDGKDFESCYEGAKHYAKDGWCGIPAGAFRAAMISACRMIGYKMTHAKLSVFVQADGFDATDGTPLVRITKGEPHYHEMAVRIQQTCDIRARPMWDAGWEAMLTVTFDHDQFTLQDVTNLLMRAGLQVGIGEGRPDSKQSCGMGWGTFNLADK